MASKQGCGRHKTGKRKLLAAERQLEALKMRRDGHTLDAIATAIGYKTRAGAHKAIVTALRESLREPSNELRELELQRLDRLLERLQVGIDDGRTKDILAALRISERRSQLLGLDVKQLQVAQGEIDSTIEFEGGSGVRVLIENEASIAVVREALGLNKTPPPPVKDGQE